MKQAKLFSLFLLLLMGSIGASAQVQLHSEMTEGTVGMLNGREAIVVDLGGSIGKVGIATMNVGATSIDDKTNNARNGNYYNWDDAQTCVSDGWYVPSQQEFDALIKRLKSNSTRRGAEIVFPQGTSLFLPSCGYIADGETGTVHDSYSLYWSSTATGATGAYAFHTSSYDDRHYRYADNKTVRCVVRPFRKLPEPDRDYLCFTAVDGDVEIELPDYSTDVVLQYTSDKENWTNFSIGEKVTIPNGQKLYWRTETARTSLAGTHFKMTGTGNIAASGNILSLLDPKVESLTISEGGFMSLFEGCTKLITAPELPTTSLASSCYSRMFSGCTGLTVAPALPVETLAEGCYSYMFSGCTGLAVAPELPATTLAESCYAGMLKGCTSLTATPALPATTLAEGCYNQMFKDCTKLANAPILPATTLAPSCYSMMFEGCEKLTCVVMKATDATAKDCVQDMFKGSAKGTQGDLIITKELDVDMEQKGYNLNLPTNWKIVSSDLIRYTDDTTGIIYEIDRQKCTATVVGLTNAAGNLTIPATVKPIETDFTVTAISEEAFKGNNRITGVTIEAALTTINQYSFAGCASLANINVPNTVTTIEAYAFKGCTSLKTFTFPSGLQTLGCDVFDGCQSLECVTSPFSTPYNPGGWSGLGNGLSGCLIVKVPSGTYNAYANNSYWSRFGIDDPADTQEWRVLAGTQKGIVVPNETYINMMDGNKDTKWCVSYFTNGYIIIKAREAHRLAEYSIQAGNDVNRDHRNRNPHSFTLYGAADLTGEWTQLHSGSGENLSAQPFGIASYYFDNENEFKYFKFKVDGSSINGHVMELSEISFVTYCEHDPSGEIFWDDYEHWKICSKCGKRAASQHSFDNDSHCKYCTYDNPDRKNWQDRDYLSFKAVGGRVNIGMEATYFTEPITLEYSYDRNSWFKFVFDEKTKYLPFPIEDGETCYLRRYGEVVDRFYPGSSITFKMSGSGKIEAGGNIMSLLDSKCESTTVAADGLCYLFENCKLLTKAPKLPATTLGNSCYYSIFRFCNNLTTAPELPATTLADECYAQMFNGCESLTTAPELPATNLARDCYSAMFFDCHSLTTPPALPATTLAVACYKNMFRSCYNLTSAPALPATGMTSDCYAYMFWECGKLTTPPALPATTLSFQCYYGMFGGCSSLTTTPILPANELATACYAMMFEGCSRLTTAPELPATTLANRCYARMFSECDGLTKAPALPATTLTEGCYTGMFSGCVNLEEAPELPAPTLEFACYMEMFKKCTKVSCVKLGTIESMSDDPEDYFFDDMSLVDWLKDTAAEGNVILTNAFYRDTYHDYVNSLYLPYSWTISRQLSANEDPDHKGEYYTTYYDSHSSYTVEDGTTAYTGTVEGECLKLTATADNTITTGEGVLLKGDKPKVLITITDETLSPVADNVLAGSDESTVASDNCYILTYGQNNLGFYKYAAGKTLAAHKAYMSYPASSSGKAFQMIFVDDDPTGFDNAEATVDTDAKIYNLNGNLMNNLQPGINIVGGKKIYVK